MIVVHHTGLGSARPTAKATALWQTGPNAGYKFPAIAYPIYVEADCSVEVCHDLETETWSNGVGSPFLDHQGEGVYNEWTVSIAFAGENPTEGQWTAIRRVAGALDDEFSQPLQLTAHGLLPGGATECAGTFVNAQLKPPVL